MLGLRNIIWEKTDFETVLKALSEGLFDVNNDFNGTNGEDFTSDTALDRGFASDLELTQDVMRQAHAMTPMNVEAIVAYFLNVLFDDEEWYNAYKYELIKHPTMGVIGVSVAWFDA